MGGAEGREVDLQEAMDRDITVAEVTHCNSICTADACRNQILALVRNYLASYR